MRLNRVLQNKLNRVSLLATISMAIAAATFTISCGEDGSNGKDGADCIVTGSAAPYQILCGGQPVGTLNNGPQGPTGNPNSNPGIPGAQGKSCLVNQSGSIWEVVCGTEVMGTLSGCSVVQNAVDNPKDFTINCGETVVNMCNNAVLEEGKFCDDEGNQGLVQECGVDKTPYIYTKQYCGFETAAAVTAGTPKVMPLCGVNRGSNDYLSGSYFSPNGAEAITNADGDTTGWVLTVESGCKKTGTAGTRCQANSVMPSDGVGGSSLIMVTNPDSVGLRSWQNEYCEVDRSPNDNKTSTSTTSTDPIWTGKTIDKYYVQQPLENTCDSILNKDSWKGEYCGWTTNGLTKLNDGCSNGGKPHTTGVTENYCAKGNAKAKLSEISSTYCTPVYTVYLDAAHDLQKTPVGAKVPLNRIQNKPNTLLTADDVADEYCGYTLVDWNKTRKSITNITNPTRNRPDTAYTSVRKSKCTDGTTLDPESAYEDGIKTYLVGEKIGVAFPDYLNQYCQATSDGQTSAKPALTSGAATAPTTLQEIYNSYCMKNPLAVLTTGDYAGMKAFSADPQTGSNVNARRLNVNTWAGEYCAYPTAAAFYAPTTLSSSSVADLDPVLLNADGDGLLGTATNPGHHANANGPSKFRTCDLKTADTTRATAAFNTPNSVLHVDKLGYWPNEYCQFKRSGFDKVVGFRVDLDLITSANIAKYKGTDSVVYSAAAYIGSPDIFQVFCPAGDTAAGAVSAGFLGLNPAISHADNAARYEFNKTYIKAYQGLLGSVSGAARAVNTLNAGGVTYNAGGNTWTVTNNTGWRSQYCGIEKTNFAPTATPALKKFSVITSSFCSDPTNGALAVQPNDYRIRDLTGYPEEYCQFALSSGQVVAQVAGLYGRGATTAFTRASELTSFDSLSVVYCLTDTAGLGASLVGTSSVSKAAWYRSKNLVDGQRMNKNSWAREYCQITTYPGGTVTKATFSKTGSLTTPAGVCDDGGLPNGAGIPRTETFQNEYCQANEEGKTSRVGGIDAYCDVPGYPENQDAWKASTIGSAYRVNEGTWKGEYCFADFKRAVCLGGQVPAVNSSGAIVNSTSTPRCRMPGETT